jgi:uncharacterized membrane protein
MKFFLRFREWLADHSSAQYPRPQVIVDPRHRQAESFTFAHFVLTVKALALAALCLLIGIPLLILSGGILIALVRFLIS